MRKHKLGFTLIEVTIFLAITGLLFLSVTIGVQNSIFQQRYNDSVQSFADFLGNVYSEVLNVQSAGDGRSNSAIYGKMVTFGEEGTDGEEQVVYVYDVVGDAVSASRLGSGSTLGALAYLNANVVVKDDEGFQAAGIVERYTPKWGARIQNASDFNDYKGTLLIVRDPMTGSVQTYVYGSVIEVQKALNGGNSSTLSQLLTGKLTADGKKDFKIMTVDFCVNPNGKEESNTRSDVRLTDGASNSSGVKVMPLDDTNNVCNRSR